MKFKRWCKWLLTSLFLALFLVSITIALIGSLQTLSPKRRQLADYHRATLAHAENFGMRIKTFTAASAMPYLVCEPQNNANAQKSLILRKELARRHTALAPWGAVRGTVLMLHSHRGRKEDNLAICERFCAAGFRCICPDLPGHGDNPEAYATFGIREKHLLESLWQEYQKLNPKATQPLFLFGYSQGGAIALQCADSAILQPRALAAVSSFSSLDQPIEASANYLPVVIRDLTPLTTRACAFGIYCRIGVFPKDISPLNAAKNITIPSFICHGIDDTFVPVANARAIFTAIPATNKTLSLIPKAKHSNTLATGSTTLYADICEHFLKAL